MTFPKPPAGNLQMPDKTNHPCRIVPIGYPLVRNALSRFIKSLPSLRGDHLSEIPNHSMHPGHQANINIPTVRPSKPNDNPGTTRPSTLPARPSLPTLGKDRPSIGIGQPINKLPNLPKPEDGSNALDQTPSPPDQTCPRLGLTYPLSM